MTWRTRTSSQPLQTTETTSTWQQNDSNEKLKKRHAAPAYNCVEPFELSATHFVSLIKTMQPFFCGKHQRRGISNFDNLWSRVSQEIQYSCRHRGSSFFFLFFLFLFPLVNVTKPACDTLSPSSNQWSAPPEETQEFVLWSSSFPEL